MLWKINTPNTITLLRIGLIPFFVIMYYLPFFGAVWLTPILFGIAAFTDWLDGYLARSLAQVSRLGAFLDPVADKLIVAVALVLIVSESTLPLVALPAAVIVGREIVISALREWMAELGKRASIAVSFIGKIKTTAQLLAILFLLIGRIELPISDFINWSGYCLLYAAAVLTLWSMLLYLKAAWPDLARESD
jgi:CDP-diacylglycerol---glycerol-3-phosphate 3-phosphatidyltransferase